MIFIVKKSIWKKIFLLFKVLRQLRSEWIQKMYFHFFCFTDIFYNLLQLLLLLSLFYTYYIVSNTNCFFCFSFYNSIAVFTILRSPKALSPRLWRDPPRMLGIYRRMFFICFKSILKRLELTVSRVSYNDIPIVILWLVKYCIIVKIR